MDIETKKDIEECIKALNYNINQTKKQFRIVALVTITAFLLSFIFPPQFLFPFAFIGLFLFFLITMVDNHKLHHNLLALIKKTHSRELNEFQRLHIFSRASQNYLYKFLETHKFLDNEFESLRILILQYQKSYIKIFFTSAIILMACPIIRFIVSLIFNV